MSLRCYFGYCHRTPNPLLTGIPDGISVFENWILANKLNLSLTGIVNHERYHAYLTMTNIAERGDIETVWREYCHFPAPTATGRRPQPVQTGDRSFAVYMQLPLPLPGGMVEHVVRPNIYSIANVTLRNQHVLYPGYIIRWLERKDDGAVISYTLGRGIGAFPETNENKGAEMFMDLDRKIRESLNSRQR